MTLIQDSQNNSENAPNRTDSEGESSTPNSDMSPDEIAIEEFCITVAWIYLLSLSKEKELEELNLEELNEEEE